MAPSPRPWRQEGQLIRAGDGSVVCRLIPWDESGCRQEDRDNAASIIASPDMLAALKAQRDQVVRWMSNPFDEGNPQVTKAIFEQIEAAIAAAEGKQ